jgi:hypothetical protein
MRKKHLIFLFTGLITGAGIYFIHPATGGFICGACTALITVVLAGRKAVANYAERERKSAARLIEALKQVAND